MKKVLRILNRFNIGGPTHNATYLTKYLHPEFQTKLIAGKKLDSEESSEYMLKDYEINFEIIEDMSRSINLIKDLKSFLKLKKLLNNLNQILYILTLKIWSTWEVSCNNFRSANNCSYFSRSRISFVFW